MGLSNKKYHITAFVLRKYIYHLFCLIGIYLNVSLFYDLAQSIENFVQHWSISLCNDNIIPVRCKGSLTHLK